jgi:O-antigen ligase
MIAAKWAIFVLVAVSAPFVGAWLRPRPAIQLRAWTVVGLLPFLGRLDMGLVVFWNFTGDTSGLVFGVIDALALTLYFAQSRPARPLPYRFALAGYFLVALASVAQAQWWLAAFGYVWTLARMVLLYAAICRASHDGRVPSALLRGMSAGILYELAWVAYQHFGLGIHRAMGTFSHENVLGMLVNLVVMASVALLLAGRGTGLSWLAVLAAPAVAFFTVSRGALLFLGIGIFLVYLLSLLRRFDRRKAMIGLVGLLLAAAATPLALATVNSRSRLEQEESLQARVQLEKAASLMLEDHPLGVGPNHFATMLFARGYGERAGVNWFNWTALVHNIYWLTAAEMGYAGVAALLVLFLTPLFPALRWSLRARRDGRADMLLGLAVGLAVFYVHSFWEWIWRVPSATYVYWMVLGMVASLTRQVRRECSRKVRLRSRAPLGAGFLAAGGVRSAEGHGRLSRSRRTAGVPGFRYE